LRAHGLEIVDLEDDDQLQDAVLSVHHACMLTVGNHNVNKLIENHNGITHAKVVGIGMQMQMPLQIPIQIPGTPPAQPSPIIPQRPAQPAPPPPQPGGAPAVPLQGFFKRLVAAFKAFREHQSKA
jgi:hypothetical protein